MKMTEVDLDSTRQNDHHFRELLTALPNVSVQGYDKARRVIYWNRASELLYGYTEAEAMGRLLEDLIIPPPMRFAVIQAHHNWIKKGIAIPTEELELINKQNRTVPVCSSHVMLYQDTDNPEMFCVDVDLSNQRNTEKQVEYLTQFDSQTGLHNKTVLFRHAETSMAACQQSRQATAALFIGVDDLTHINNVFGYNAGDSVIINVANRLREKAQPQDFIARFSGDVFVLLIHGKDLTERIDELVDNLKTALSTPYKVNEESRKVTVSAGICIDHQSAGSHIRLLKHAEIAMNQAKLFGKNQFLYYQPSFEDALQRGHQLLSALSSAIEKAEFSLVYQPQYDQNKHIVSCEALVRWQSQELGNISPAEFIPLAEKKHKIKMIDRWVLCEVLKQIAQWLESGLEPMRVYINMSGQSLGDMDFFDFYGAGNKPRQCSLSPYRYRDYRVRDCC